MQQYNDNNLPIEHGMILWREAICAQCPRQWPGYLGGSLAGRCTRLGAIDGQGPYRYTLHTHTHTYTHKTTRPYRVRTIEQTTCSYNALSFNIVVLRFPETYAVPNIN